MGIWFTGVKAVYAAAALNGGHGDVDPAPLQEPAATIAAGRTTWNPNLAIVGDFVATLRDSQADRRRADFREIEFSFAADADPHLKVEIYVALANEDGETHTEVEEAFGRYSNLGGGLSAKFGKLAAAVGRVQRNHADQLLYLDYPLVLQDILGEEGLRRPGASLSYLFPGDRFQELTVEGLDGGDEGPLFNGSDLDSPVWLGHYRTFFDFSEDLSGQLGLTAACGPSAGSNRQSSLFGLDWTSKWQPGEKGRSAIVEAEAYWSKLGGTSQSTFGYFGRVAFEVRPRVFLVGGIDYSELPGTSDSRRGWLAGATVKVSEFHHWRLEYQQVRSTFEPKRNTLNLQFQWQIGAHPAHKY